jgi:hypothetical protein
MNVGSLAILFGLKLDQNSFDGVFKKLLALKAIASSVSGLVDIARDLGHMAIEAASAGTHLLGTSQALGMSTRAIQQWSYVAKQAGSDVNQFTVGVSMFERNLKEFGAGRGSKRFKDAMHEVGMTSQEARDALLKPDGVNAAIFKVADAYQKMGNNANRAAINTGLFGARARGMAQDLGQGSAALKAQLAHLDSIGGIVDEGNLKNLKVFNNAIEDIKTSWNALFMQIVGGLGPGFAKMLNDVTEWIGKNRQLIEEVLTKAFHIMEVGFKVAFAAFKIFAEFVKGVMNGDVGPVALFSLMLATITLAAAAIWTLLLPSVVALGSALWVAMLPLLPYTLALAAIIALVILISKHWDQIAAGAKRAWEATKKGFSDFWNWLVGEFTKAGDWFVRLGHNIKEFFGGIWDYLGDKLTWLVNKAIAGVNKIISVLNHLPGVNISEIAELTSSADNKKAETSALQRSGFNADGKPITNTDAVMQSMRQANNNFTAGMRGQPITIGSTTINIHGVKDADEAKDKIAQTIDSQHRHAAAALGGDND